MFPAVDILTLGHSNIPQAEFAATLAVHRIAVLVDVRSSPFSSRAPQFNKNELTQWVPRIGVSYVFAGKVLGGRPDNPLFYEFGRVSYRRMAAAAEFEHGLAKLCTLGSRGVVALMCAEAEPLECHRFLLLSRALKRLSYVHLRHILADGSVEPHGTSERRLIRTTGLAQSNLFTDYEASLEEAYSLQENRVAYRPSTPLFAAQKRNES